MVHYSEITGQHAVDMSTEIIRFLTWRLKLTLKNKFRDACHRPEIGNKEEHLNMYTIYEADEGQRLAAEYKGLGSSTLASNPRLCGEHYASSGYSDDVRE